MSATAAGARALPPLGRDKPYRVVFVCTGNICRSPMAEVVTRSLAQDAAVNGSGRLVHHVAVSSAGTGPWHEGEPMHERAMTALERAGFPSHPHVAHQFSTATMGSYDLIVALDRSHQQTLRGLGAPPERLFLLRWFETGAGAAADVPDPYYGDDAEFDACLGMITAGCQGLVSAMASLFEA